MPSDFDGDDLALLTIPDWIRAALFQHHHSAVLGTGGRSEADDVNSNAARLFRRRVGAAHNEPVW